MKWTATLCAALLCALPAFAQSPSAKTASQYEAQIQHMQATLHDWANLGRYRAADEALAPPASGVERVVFFGDSITDFWPIAKSFPGKPYVNRGISGQTTPQMLVRFQQDVVALHPAVVVILAGTNDIAGNTGPETEQMIEDNFVSMCDIAHRSGIRVVLASILPASKYPWRPSAPDPAPEIRNLNQWLKGFARGDGDVYLDYYDSLVNGVGGMKPDLTKDGYVHPNAAGYAVMAPLAEQAIEEALRK